jgi:hypothetical protein
MAFFADFPMPYPFSLWSLMLYTANLDYKLWKLLIDRNMRKEDLRLATGFTTTAIAKLGKNETVHMFPFRRELQ